MLEIKPLALFLINIVANGKGVLSLELINLQLKNSFV